MGQTDAVAEQSGVVAVWLIPMHLSFPFQFTLQRFLQSQVKTWVLAYISGGALALHVFVSWFFVYKLRVGIVGAALTLDFSWWVTVLGLFVYVVCGGCADSWTGFSGQAFVGLWDFFKLSVASGVMVAVLIIVSGYLHSTEVAVDALSICITIFGWESMIPLGFLAAAGVLIIVSGYLHNTEVAVDALSICITIFGWQSMIPLGFLAAAGVRVANELGAGNAKGAKFATTISVLSSLMVGLLFWSIIIAFPENLAMIFTSSTSVIEMVNDLAVLLAFTILFNCIQPVLSGVAIGSGWQAKVAFINIANELGAGNAKGAKFATTISVLSSLMVGLLFWSIIIAFPENLAMIFTSSTSVIEMVNDLAVLLAFTILFNCIQPVLSGVAIGSGWQAKVAFINIGSYYLVGVPLGVLLGWSLHFGITGIWTGMISGTVIQTLILAIITLRCEWEKELPDTNLISTSAQFTWPCHVSLSEVVVHLRAKFSKDRSAKTIFYSLLMKKTR
nr:protein detoxification 27 [Quercus suber]